MSSSQPDKSSDIVSGEVSATEIRRTGPHRQSGGAPGGRIDEVDHDGRSSNTEIGRALGLTETTIRKRISRLVGEGLMSIVAVPTPEAVGMTTSAIIGISVQLASLHTVSEALVALPEVRYVGLSTGRYDVMIEAFFDDPEHLLEFISTRLGGMPGVTSVETSLILKVAKFSYEWEIP